MGDVVQNLARRIGRKIGRELGLIKPPPPKPKPAPKPQPKPKPKPPKFSGVLDFWRLPVSLNCPICRHDAPVAASRYPTAKTDRFSKAIVLWCTRCGSRHVPEGDRLLGDYYRLDYATTNRGDRDIAPDAYFGEDAENPKLTGYFRRAEAHFRLLKEHGARFDRVLDFGSGPGYFLKVAAPNQAFAVEPDEASHKYLHYLGATRIDTDGLGEAQFDVIEASHSIEHLTGDTLHSNIDYLVCALKPGGLMLVEVPQGGFSRLQITARHAPHTLFFTPQGIREALTRPGLDLLRTETRTLIDAELHPAPIYTPDPEDRFASSRGGDIVVILRKA